MLQDIDRIIARHLSGDATPEEQGILQAWLAASEQNRTFFAALVSDVQPDTEQAWRKFERHIQQSASVSPPRAAVWRLGLRYAVRYAAVVALLIGAGALVWIRYGSDSDTAQQAWVLAESKDEAREYILHDSTSVSLNKDSRLSCIDVYDDGCRQLQLEGEAFFEVAPSSSGQLVVHAEETFIRDLGTAFNVQAYPQSSAITVFVQSGEVHFYVEADSGLILKAGETGIFDKHTKQFSRAQTDVNAAAYATKVFAFKDKPLGEVVALINRVYNARIHIADSAVAAQTISVMFDNENFEEIVEIISETMHLQVAQSGDEYWLRQ
jgi:ferric-dicitrate binding protein FerR (iron transport regulator)